MAPAARSRAAFWLLASVALVALAVRLALWAAERGRPQFEVAVLDSRFYLEMGKRLASGDALPPRPFFLSPGYSAFVALCAALRADPQPLVVLLQILADVGACVAVAWLALRRLGRLGGWVAGLLLALHGPQLLFTTRILDATLGSCLVALLALLCERLESDRRLRWPLLTGAALGLLALLRSTALVFAPLLLFAIARWRGRAGRPGETGWLRSGAAFAGALLVVIAPVTIRNWVVERGFVLLTSSGGVNFLVGNHPASDGRFTSLNLLPLPSPGQFADDPVGGQFELAARHYAETQSQRPLTAAATSDFFGELAWAEIRSAPLAWSTLLLRKLWLFVNAFEVPQVDNVYFLARYVPWLEPLSWSSRLLWPLALFGIVAGFRRAQRPWLLVALYATYAATIALFFVTDRYRLWITPLAAFFAAAGVVALVDLARSRRWNALSLQSGALAAVGLFCNLNPALFEPRVYARARLGALADALDAPGRDRGGWFRIAPDYYDFKVQHYNMAARCLERDDFDGALAECQAGLAEAPGDPLLRQKLAAVVAPVAEAAAAAYEQRDYAKARPLAERWCRLIPDEPEAWNTLGAARLKLGEADAGIAGLRKAAALAPAVGKYRYNLALALMQLGRLAEAAPLFEALVAQQPKNAKLQELLRRCQPK